MDEQLETLRIFRLRLIRFHMDMQQSMRDLQKSHDRVSPIWHDDMRKEYDKQWEPLSEMMLQFIKREGPRYIDFLTKKITELDGYLHGGH